MARLVVSRTLASAKPPRVERCPHYWILPLGIAVGPWRWGSQERPSPSSKEGEDLMLKRGAFLAASPQAGQASPPLLCVLYSLKASVQVRSRVVLLSEIKLPAATD